MNLYEISNLENQIEKIAENNSGEIPEHLFQELIEAQTQSLVQIENLCQYIRHLELGIETCKTEEARIKKMREKATNRIEGIKTYLTPYVKQQKKIEAGTFKLSTLKSESVIITDENSIPSHLRETVWIEKFDKNNIKKELKSGLNVPGAELQENDNLQIK